MLTILLNWFKSFDAVKAVVLAIVVMVSSWYDLRAEVRDAKVTAVAARQELTQVIEDHKHEDEITFEASRARDAIQDARSAELRADLREALKDLKDEIRRLKR